jgi:hypothetical protein
MDWCSDGTDEFKDEMQGQDVLVWCLQEARTLMPGFFVLRK